MFDHRKHLSLNQMSIAFTCEHRSLNRYSIFGIPINTKHPQQIVNFIHMYSNEIKMKGKRHWLNHYLECVERSENEN